MGRKSMELDSLICDLCILHKRETGAHLFLRGNFSKARWKSLRVTVPQIFRRIKSKLAVPFSMEIIIIMASSIWLTRNDWIFNNVDPSVEDCRRKFK
jgi:hypothetical protein